MNPTLARPGDIVHILKTQYGASGAEGHIAKVLGYEEMKHLEENNIMHGICSGDDCMYVEVRKRVHQYEKEIWNIGVNSDVVVLGPFKTLEKGDWDEKENHIR